MISYKKLILLALISIISGNVSAIDTKISNPLKSKTLFSTYAEPVLKRAILYGSLVAYFKYFEPNNRGNDYMEQSYRKIIDYIIAGVVLYDPLKEDFKSLKNYSDSKWKAIFKKLDELYATHELAA